MNDPLPQFFVYWISVTLIHADPQWIIRPTDQSVQIGHNVTFFCEVDDIEGVGIVWQRGEKILFLNHLRHNAPDNYYITGDQSRGQFNMVVTNVQQSDNDVFKCSVGQSSLKQSVQLTVIVPPRQPNLHVSVTGQLTAGQTVSFTCTSSGGNPPPVISWSLNGQPITTGYTVSPPEVKFGETRSVLIRQLTKSDHGSEMRCSAENLGNQGLPVYTNTVLQVQYGPYVTVMPSNAIRVIEHKNATLWCDVDANPAVSSVQWFMGGVLQQETGFKFHITRALSGVHNTVYECVAINKIMEGRNVTTVEVIYPPKITIPKSSDGFLYVNESSDVDISCLVDANPKAEKTEWMKSGSSSVVSGSLLSIKNVNRHQAGTYICRSSNVLAATGHAVQTVSRNQSLQLVVQYAPGTASIVQTLASLVTTGQQVTLTCSIDSPGFPVGEIIWTKDGDTSFHFMGSLLRFLPIRLEHTGIYVCRARNLLGKGTAARRELMIKEETRFLSPVLDSMKTVNLLEDRDISISCRVRGKPPPQVTWYKDGRAISAMTSDLYQVTVTESTVDVHSYEVTSTLQFQGVRRSPSLASLRLEDSGNYTCLASNNVGTDKVRTLTLVIQYPPVVSVTVSKVAVDMNQTVTLECHAHSVPRPHFRWFHFARELTTGGRYNIRSVRGRGKWNFSSELTLSDVQWSDLGDYVCVAGNPLGNASVTVHLAVKTIPDAPAGLMVRDSTWESVFLEWSPQFDGGYAQTFVIYYTSLTQQSQEIQAGSLFSFNISDLFPSTEYTFRVFARNTLGASPYSRGVDIHTDDFTVPTPSSAVYDPAQQIVTFSSPSELFCVQIFISSDTSGHWRLYEPCAPSRGGSVKISAELDAKLVNLSLCLERRQNVCSLSVLAIAAAPPAGSSVELIIIGCVCGLLITALVCSLVVLRICHHRNRTNGNDQKLGDKVNNVKKDPRSEMRNGSSFSSRTGFSSPKINNTNTGFSQTLESQAQSFSDIQLRSSEFTGVNHNQPQAHKPNGYTFDNRIFSGHHGNVAYGYHKQYNNHSHYDHHNRQHLSSPVMSMDHSNHLAVDVDALNKKNLKIPDSPNSDMNSSADSVGPLSSNSSQRMLKYDSGSHGNDSESGYSTPDSSKPKKVVYEVIV